MTTTLSKSASQSIQVMRAFAALAVVMQHTLHEAAHLTTGSWPTRAEHWSWGMGVDVFFIISGIIMAHTTRHAPRTLAGTGQFWLRRLIRILPTYWMFSAIMLLAVLMVPAQLDKAVFTPVHAALSFLLIPHLSPSLPHEVQPLLALGWTLQYEMFFYFAFGLLLMVKRPAVALGLLTACFAALFALATANAGPAAFNQFFGYSLVFEFIYGIVLYQLVTTAGPRLRLLVPFVALPLFTWGMAVTPWGDARLFGLGSMAAILMALALYHPFPASRATRAMARVGDASYALYLSHPFVLAVCKITAKFLHLGAVPFVAVAVVVSVIFALVFHLGLEAPLHDALQKQWMPRKAA